MISLEKTVETNICIMIIESVEIIKKRVEVPKLREYSYSISSNIMTF